MRLQLEKMDNPSETCWSFEWLHISEETFVYLDLNRNSRSQTDRAFSDLSRLVCRWTSSAKAWREQHQGLGLDFQEQTFWSNLYYFECALSQFEENKGLTVTYSSAGLLENMTSVSKNRTDKMLYLHMWAFH